MRVTAGQVGDDKASATYWQQGSPETVYYGGALDTWGRSWTVAELNSADFGVDLSPYNVDSSYRTGFIDVIQAKIYYTEAGGAGDVDKVNSVDWDNVDSVNSVSKANIDKINGVNAT